MESKGARLALIVGAAAVAVTLLVVLRPSEDDEEEPAATAPAEVETGDEGSGGAADSGQSGGGRAGAPNVTTIRVEDGSPVGGVADIEVQRDDRVAILVRAGVTDEVHVHGYDLLAEVRPGRPAELRFRATLEGVFEVELEGTHTQIARLAVAP